MKHLLSLLTILITNLIIFTIIAFRLLCNNNWSSSSFNIFVAPFYFGFLVIVGFFFIALSYFIINKIFSDNSIRALCILLVSLIFQYGAHSFFKSFTNEKKSYETLEDMYNKRIETKLDRTKNILYYRDKYDYISKKGDVFLPDKNSYMSDSIKIINYFKNILNSNYQTLQKDSVKNDIFCKLFKINWSYREDTIGNNQYIDSLRNSIHLFKIMYSKDLRQLVFFIGYNIESEIERDKKEDFGECLMFYGIKKNNNIIFFEDRNNFSMSNIPSKELAFYYVYFWWTGNNIFDLPYYSKDSEDINDINFWDLNNAFKYFKSKNVFIIK